MRRINLKTKNTIINLQNILLGVFIFIAIVTIDKWVAMLFLCYMVTRDIDKIFGIQYAIKLNRLMKDLSVDSYEKVKKNSEL